MKYSLLLMKNPEDGILDPDKLENYQAARYWVLLKEQGLVSLAFPAGDVETDEQWLALLANPTTTVGLVLLPDRTDPVAHINLTSFQGYSAMLHFAVLRDFHGKEAVKIGIETLENLSKFKRVDGTPFLESVWGLTPVWNRAACWFTKKIGMTKVDIIPHSYYIKSEDKFVDGLLTKKIFDNWQTT